MKKVVLRFNIKAFRNNYFISDLVKMNLEYHAIEVGRISIDRLAMKSEFANTGSENHGFEVGDKALTASSNDVRVYDVILAGVNR